jgi:ribosome-associated protein
MDDTRVNEWETRAVETTALLAEHKAVEPVMLDLRPFSLWTDFFVVAGVTSAAHLDGLRRHIEEWAKGEGLTVRKPVKTRAGLGGVSQTGMTGESGASFLWEILDMGNLVVHLMSKEARAFYDLERLWASPR